MADTSEDLEVLKEMEEDFENFTGDYDEACYD